MMTRLQRVALMAGCMSIGFVLFPRAGKCQDDLGFQSGAITAATIDSFLTQKKSPMAGSGNSFLQSGQTYNVDPALVVAISGIETSFATHTCTADNAWNWFWQGPCPQSPFTSYSDGIDTVSKFLRLSYIDKGYNSITLIQKRYCTAPVQNGVTCPGWISTVTQFRAELLGTTSTTTSSDNPSGSPPGVPPPTPTPGPAPSPGPQPLSANKMWWIAGGAVLVAAGAGWLLGHRRRTA